MNTDELKALQAPLKLKYKEHPESAIITLKASGKIDSGITFNVESFSGTVKAGLHPATGGDGSSACSADMLLEALVACAGVTLNAVATAMNIPLRDCIIKAEGDIDFRGTLGISKEAPVGFKEIRLSFEPDTNATVEEIDTLIKLTERYCVVLQTLQQPARFVISHPIRAKK